MKIFWTTMELLGSDPIQHFELNMKGLVNHLIHMFQPAHMAMSDWRS